MGTDQIERINLEELKEKIDGKSSLVNKLKYRGRKAAANQDAMAKKRI